MIYYCMYKLCMLLAAALLLCMPNKYFAYTNPCGDGFVPFPSSSSSSSWHCEPNNQAYVSSMAYLRKNLPSFDEINMCSLGFSEKDDVNVIDGGIASLAANLSLGVKGLYSWAASVPVEVFNEFVLPYGNVNEARTNFRPLILQAVQAIFSSAVAGGRDIDAMSITDVVLLINQQLWSGNPVLAKSIVFKSSQTPLIYDPMSTLAFGYASCTGVSIFFIDALRSVGVPARIAGTPAWNGDPANGNHNWVEVWTGSGGDGDIEGQWEFIEAAPAGAGETLSNPCDKWFCTPSKFVNGTQVFAARFDQGQRVRYPMAWDVPNMAIPGQQRSLYYQKACNVC